MVLNKFKKLTPSGKDSLEKKVFKGGFWLSAMKVLQKLFGLIRNIILARLLAPNDFGLFGIALLFLSLVSRFTEIGLGAAVIQKKGKVKKYLNTVWSFVVARNTLITILIVVLSPIVAGFFNEPEVSPLIMFLSLSVFFTGFTNAGVLYFKKELDFHKEFILRAAGPFLNLVIAVILAIIYRNVWALVIGSVIGALTTMIVSYFIHPFRPKFKLNFTKLEKLFGFGKWVWGSNVLSFLLMEGDDIFVGKLLGSTSLGVYQMAYRIAVFIPAQTAKIVNQLTFPAYSKVQDNISKLRKGYSKILKLNSVINIPLTFLIFYFIFDFTVLVLGEKWLMIVPAAKALTVWGLLYSFDSINSAIFYGLGRPNITTNIQIVKLILTAALIYPLTVRYQLIGTVYSIIIPAILAEPIIFYYIINLTKISLKEILKNLFYPLLAITSIVFVIYSIEILFRVSTSFLSFFGLAFLSVIGYAVWLIFYDRVGLFTFKWKKTLFRLTNKNS